MACTRLNCFKLGSHSLSSGIKVIDARKTTVICQVMYIGSTCDSTYNEILSKRQVSDDVT